MARSLIRKIRLYIIELKAINQSSLTLRYSLFYTFFRMKRWGYITPTALDERGFAGANPQGQLVIFLTSSV
jgi:hypothetical protein